MHFPLNSQLLTLNTDTASLSHNFFNCRMKTEHLKVAPEEVGAIHMKVHAHGEQSTAAAELCH